MRTDSLKLYKPSIEIRYNASLEELINDLQTHEFVLTEPEDWHPILHGQAWITEEDKVVIHFHFTNEGKLESFMISSVNYMRGDTLLRSYIRKQNWL